MLLWLLCSEHIGIEIAVSEQILIYCARKTLAQLCMTHPDIRAMVLSDKPSVARLEYMARHGSWLNMLSDTVLGGPGHNIVTRLNRITIGRLCCAHSKLDVAARTHQVTRAQLVAREYGCNWFDQMAKRELAAEAVLATTDHGPTVGDKNGVKFIIREVNDITGDGGWTSSNRLGRK
eukprot:SAG11_NODE_3011_length_2766_cov_2.386577_1_plen_177_part_00